MTVTGVPIRRRQGDVPPNLATGVAQSRTALAALVLLLGLSTAGVRATAQPAADRTAVRRGMTPAEVRQILGPPARVARQILFRRHLEQWVYDQPEAVRVEFNCVRGEEPYVLTVTHAAGLAP